MLGVLLSANDKIRLDFIKIELLFEKIDYRFCIHTVLAGVDIGTDKSALRESVDADVAFGDDDEPTPATWVLYVVIRSFYDEWFCKSMHIEERKKLADTGQHILPVIELVVVAPIPIYSDVLAKMHT